MRFICRLQGALTLCALLILSACGGNSPTTPGLPAGPQPGPNDLSGTVIAPAGGDVSGTLVIACSDANCTSPLGATVTQPGQSGPFLITAVPGVQYVLVAIKDANGNNNVEEPGDFIGVYTVDGTNAALVTPPAANLNIQLQGQVATAPGTPTPGVPGGGASGKGSVTGTLIFPGSRENAALHGAGRVGDFDLSDFAFVSSALASLEPDMSLLRSVPAPFLTSRPAEVVPGEVIVKYESGASTLGAEPTLKTLNNKLSGYSFAGEPVRAVRALALRDAGLYRAEGLSAAETVALAEDLSARADVLYAEPNAMRYALETPNDEYYGIQWHYPAMNLPNAWDIEDGTSNPVTVAVVDTGAVTSHPDMAGVFVGGYDFISDAAEAADGDGRDADANDVGQDSGYHGLHVAGTVAASTNNGTGVAGVSWGAKVVPVRVLGVSGGGTLADIIDGTLWAGGLGTIANPNPADVINLSLGGTAPCSGAEEDVFAQLKAAGVVVIVAAGNSNEDAGFSSPANCDNVITVGATGPQNNRAPYSNYGDTIDVMAPGGDTSQSIDFGGQQLLAGVWSPLADDTGDTFYSAYQGTSMAAPHVAGLAALILSQDPTITPDAVLARLVASATPLSNTACGGETCGAGLIDAAKALSSTDTGPAPGDPPAPPETGDVDTFVAAFFCTTDACNEYDSNLSEAVFVPTTGLEVPFEVTGLEPGLYIVAAWQDINGDQEVSEGEPFGFHRNNLRVAADAVVDRADIYLEPAELSSSALSLNANLNTALPKLRAARVALSTDLYDVLEAWRVNQGFNAR